MSPKSKTFANILVFLVALFLFSSFQDRSTISIDFEDNALLLGAPNDFSLSIAYDQIETLELSEQPDSGSAISGDENRKCRWGEWENDTWGKYTQCTLKKVDPIILLTTSDGEIVVFNYESEDATTSMHQMLSDLLAHYESGATQ